MSLQTTMLLGWSAVHLFVAALYFVVFIRNPGDPEYRSFGGLAAGLSILLLGAAASAHSPDMNTVARGLAAVIAGGGLAVAAYTSLILRLMDAWTTSASRAASLWVFISAGLALSGLASDPGSSSRFGNDASALTLAGGLWAAASVVLIVGLSLRATRSPVPAVRTTGIGAVCAAAAAFHDVIKLTAGSPLPFILENIAFIVTLFAGLGLSERVLEAGDRLETRTSELRENLTELQRVRRELVRNQQQAAVGELAAALAHEIRNPLAVMRNGVSALRRGRSEDTDTLLGILDEEAERLNQLVGDLRSYASASEPGDEPLSLRSLLEEAGAAAISQHGAGGARDLYQVSLDLDNAPDRLWGDAKALRLALTNILTNALQAIPRGGTVWVQSSPATLDGASAIAVAIRDDGEGMAAVAVERALHPFFTTRPRGTGLGLAIVDRVLREHGGRLTIESGESSGTTVTLVLRRAPPPERPRASRRPSMPPAGIPQT